MSVRSTLVFAIETLRQQLYRGPVRRIVRATGLESRFRWAYSWILGSVSDEDVVSHELNGVTAKFRVSTGLEVQRFHNLMEEFDVIETLLSDIDEDEVFFDVGANVGLYTCFLSQKADRTVAFEPHPENLTRLDDNLILNDLTNVTVRSEALSDTNGTADLAVKGTNVAGEGTHSLATGGERNTIEITTVRGDSLVHELPAPDMIKIDVEGAELAVLRGLEETLMSCSRVYCETHASKLRSRDHTVDDVHELLASKGFTVEVIENRGDEQFIRAVRTDDE